VWCWFARACLVLGLLLLSKAAKALLLPVAMALVLGVALSPAVRRLQRMGIAPALGAGIVFSGLIALATLLTLAVAAPLSEWLAHRPEGLELLAARWSTMLFGSDKPSWLAALVIEPRALVRQAADVLCRTC